MRIILILILGIATSFVHGATINFDGSASDCQAKINSASNGDTVLGPASGSYTWSSGSVSIPNTKYITLDGNGRPYAVSISITVTPHASGNTRITGFTFTFSGS